MIDPSDESKLNDLLARTREQDRIIGELMGSVERLQMRCADLERARLTIDKVIKCDMETQETMMILAIHDTENGIIVEVAG
jgi:hypothetical protein